MSSGKWRGQVHNLLAKTKSGRRKRECTPCFGTKAEAKRALLALKAKLDEAYWTSREALAKQDPTTADVPRAPDDIADAAPRTAYWVPNSKNNHVPQRIVRTGTGNGKQGFYWYPACRHASGCSNRAELSKDGKLEFCQAHGGTACAHGPNWTRCMHCNGGAEGKVRVNMCNVCNSVELAAKRQTTKNGNGMCASCEQHKRKEARDAGVDAPSKSARWEDVFLDGTDEYKGVCMLVTDEKGVVIKYESRDDMKNMLGSNRKRRRGECDTNHQRRPDVLWLVRDRDGRIVAAVMVEVDEHSHGDRDPECEGGKVGDTFAAICQLAQTEGKARLAVARKGVVRMPYVLFLRVNPNACDAEGSNIGIKTRIRVVAKKVREFLRTPQKEFYRRADARETMLPHVECLYYHTREGAKNLALYREKHDEKSLYFHGNTCPRERKSR
jgi:hypothetical protein